MVGNDRQLNADGDEIKHDITVSAGQHQVDFYAYGAPIVGTIQGSEYIKVRGAAHIQGDNLLIQRAGEPQATVRSPNRTPGATDVPLDFYVKGNRQARCCRDGRGRARWPGYWSRSAGPTSIVWSP